MTQQKEYWAIETPDGEIVHCVVQDSVDRAWMFFDYFSNGSDMEQIPSEEFKKLKQSEGYKAVKLVRCDDEQNR